VLEVGDRVPDDACTPGVLLDRVEEHPVTAGGR
jgi:hypothetical protein